MQKAQYSNETIEVVAFATESPRQVALTLKTGYGTHHLEVQTEENPTERFCWDLEEQVSEMLNVNGVLMTIFVLTSEPLIEGVAKVVDRTVL